MSLEQKLLSLDEHIWKQYEKVTQKANKELGWNKYDLATLTDKCFGTSLLGFSTYLFLHSSSYFRDQIMTPPTKKKAFLKTVYEKITAPLKQKELVPLPSENNYQTIDGIIE